MDSDALDITSLKKSARTLAYSARKSAQSRSASIAACGHLTELLEKLSKSSVVSGYMPIQTEINPMPTMSAMVNAGHRVCVPVIQGRGLPLLFREWTPDCAMIEGDYGALIPRGGDMVEPDVAIVPLVGFDRKCHRLGYGGGYYDRTLAKLRKNPGFQAIGFAFAAQQLDDVPTDKYDQNLDMIVTENGVIKRS